VTLGTYSSGDVPDGFHDPATDVMTTHGGMTHEILTDRTGNVTILFCQDIGVLVLCGWRWILEIPIPIREQPHYFKFANAVKPSSVIWKQWYAATT
jgi:hypothetical protein